MTNGTQIDLLLSGLRDDDDNPLSGGKVFTYETGQSVTTKPTYTDPGLTTLNTNPIILDRYGRFTCFATSGQYRFVIQDSSGTTIRTLDGISYPVIGTVAGTDSSYFVMEGDALVLYKDWAEVQRW